MMERKVIPVKLKDLVFGGGEIYIQSMLNVPSTDIEGSVRQAMALQQAGCDIIRAAIPDKEAVKLIPAIKEKVDIPLVADIHFDYRLALESVAAGVDKIRLNPGNIGDDSRVKEVADACRKAGVPIRIGVNSGSVLESVAAGVDKIRLNPGNIGDDSRVKEVADACRKAGVPIRIGVNSGSVEKGILAKYGGPTAQALVESGLYHARLLEKFDFDQIVISIKSSDVKTMVEAYTMLAGQCSYPLHLGVTEAGTERMGIIKSAVGIGSLLLQGIGETIRVSLTADPVKEVGAAKDILKSVGMYEGPQVVSCPTCGRTRIDLISLANQVEERLQSVHKPVKVAVMGCVVNGPGEAKEADIGIAGGVGCGVSLANQVEERLQSVHKPVKVAVMGCVVNGPGEAKEADIGIAGGVGCGVLFKKGEILRKVPEAEILDALMEEIEKL